jgi:hypothetical protein
VPNVSLVAIPFQNGFISPSDNQHERNKASDPDLLDWGVKCLVQLMSTRLLGSKDCGKTSTDRRQS